MSAAASLPELDATVSPQSLKALLDQAFMDSRFDDAGDLYVSEGIPFPVWVLIDRPRKLILFHTYVSTQPVDAASGATIANELNKDLVLVQFHVQEATLNGNAWLSYEGGFSKKAFIRTLQHFSSAFAQALREPCSKLLFAVPGSQSVH